MIEKTQPISSTQYSGLTSRLLLYVILCSTLLAVISFLLHHHHVRELYLDGMAQQLALIEEGLVPALAAEAYDDSFDELYALLQAVTKVRGVVYVQLYSQIPEHEQYMEAGDSSKPFDESRRYYLPAKKSEHKNTFMGSLLVRVSHKEMDTHLKNEARYIILIALLFIALLSLMYFMIVQLSVTRFLVHLAKYLKQLNIDNLNVPLNWSRWRGKRRKLDELDLIANGIEQLCDNLHQEIEGREQALLALSASEEFYRQVVEDQTELIVQYTAEGVLTYVNNAVCKFMGAPREELIGQKADNFLFDDDIPELYKRINNLSVQEPVAYREYYLMHPVDGKRLISWTSRGYFDHDENLVQIQSTGRDVTDQANIIQELKLRDQAIRCAPYGIAITDPTQHDNPAVFINPAFEQMTGFSSHEILNHNLRFLHGGDRDQPGLIAMRKAITEQKQVEVTFRNYRKDGSMYWVDLILAPMHNAQGQLTNFTSIQTDVTERILANDRQKLLVHELDHRVKNVLATVVALASQTLRTSKELPQFKEVFLGRIQALARAHEVLASEKWAGIYMAQLVELVFGHQLPEQSDRIHLNGPKVRLKAHLSSPLCMTLHELLTNAMKYGSLKNPQGEITLTWDVLGENDNQTVQIHWQEDCPVTCECCDGLHTPGVGLNLIKGLVTYEMNGKIDHSFTSKGLVCHITIPNCKNKSDS